ncbi:DUF1389 domain-containing protein [Chlamydia caviae]|uniref:Uncharacterized protein n=1 Tax=Chlamydia caviae (strain ATCC VR-813 / DSM 19441 / 03DC25 / GPIC) TaxID=227941 RepID=Q822Z6_CHLCV|nr:DUF1389 domain-containing protein [Chlamydia caviae]AAP05273.1 conserved hypothetical protein [Chlamydia caviae GPIC]
MSGIILHSLFKNDCRCHASYSFDKRIQDRLTIAIVMAVISAISLIIAIIPAIIMATPIGFVWAGTFGTIALALFVFAMITNYLRKNMPEGFKEVLKENYPDAFCKFIQKKQLTIQEIRLLLHRLEEVGEDRGIAFHKYLGDFPKKLKAALCNYGVSNFIDDLEEVDLASLNSVLTSNCPIYWLRKFIKIAPESPTRDFVNASHLEIASYWLGKSGGCRNAGTIFSKNTHLIAQRISREDFEACGLYARNADWGNEQVEEIKHKISDACLQIGRQGDEDSGIDVTQFFTGIQHSLLELCTHGISWDQLSLIKSLDVENWDFLCALDGSKQGVRRFAVPCLGEVSDEQNHLYEPLISLLTWRDFDNLGLKKESIFTGEVRNPESRLLKYFNRQSRYHKSIDFLNQEQVLDSLPRYSLNLSTGEKRE